MQLKDFNLDNLAYTAPKYREAKEKDNFASIFSGGKDSLVNYIEERNEELNQVFSSLLKKCKRDAGEKKEEALPLLADLSRFYLKGSTALEEVCKETKGTPNGLSKGQRKKMMQAVIISSLCVSTLAEFSVALESSDDNVVDARLGIHSNFLQVMHEIL